VALKTQYSTITVYFGNSCVPDKPVTCFSKSQAGTTTASKQPDTCLALAIAVTLLEHDATKHFFYSEENMLLQ
jgi:hypothetical protein